MIDPFEYADANPSELGQQTALFMQAAIDARMDVRWKLLFAIPNGGLRDKITASRLKMSGVRAGVPDVFLAVPVNYWHGMFVEMKTTHGKLQEEQQEWIAALHSQGYCVRVCFGMRAAYLEIINYLMGWIKR